jgi:hypothetical protein
MDQIIPHKLKKYRILLIKSRKLNQNNIIFKFKIKSQANDRLEFKN